MTADDERHMARALELAAGAAFTSPNPPVGAVLVRDGAVAGEGRHEGPGTPHAEALALESAGPAARGGTLYVTLEPCDHHGTTPPCAPAIVAAGVARVVVAIEDPDERVRGRGLARLRAAGVEVSTGVLASRARELKAGFIRHRTTGRPLVTLKLALSIDGRLAAPDGSSRWITGSEARARVHRARSRADAVMVGAGTVAADDPALTARDVEARRQPVRIVVDAAGRVRPEAAVFADGEVIVATTHRAEHEVVTGWKEAGAEVVVLDQDTRGGVDLRALLEVLGARGMLEVRCEGGAELATSLLAADLVARLEVHGGPLLLGRGGPDIGELGLTTITDASRWHLASLEQAGDDFIARYERGT